MIDIHSHVLPGVDDGARTPEESLEMLRIAARCGVTDIVATPHANTEFPYDGARIQKAYESLRFQARDFINLHLGSDFHLSYVNLLDALSSPQKYTINRHQYLMVELPDFISIPAIGNALTQLISARFIPIITHPERNVSLQSRPNDLEAWVRQGALVQITAQSLTGRFGSGATHAANKLLKAGLVHFIASDAHDCVDRPPDLSAAYNYVLALRTREEADALFLHNPAAALHGDSLPAAKKRARKTFLFLK